MATSGWWDMKCKQHIPVVRHSTTSLSSLLWSVSPVQITFDFSVAPKRVVVLTEDLWAEKANTYSE